MGKPDVITYKDVYIRLVKQGESRKLYVVADQGLSPKNCQYDSPGFRTSHEIGTYFKLDIEPARDNKFYRAKKGAKPKEVDPPTGNDLAEAKLRVEITQRDFDMIKLERAEKKQQEFTEKNKIPPIPDDLVVDKETWAFAAGALNMKESPLLLGPKGCGKTTMAKALADALGMKYERFSMGASLKPEQFFVGMLHAEEGTTKLIESEFLRAFQSEEPTLIFCDEITRIPTSASNFVINVFDSDEGFIRVKELGNKRIYRGENVRFVLAGNVGMQYTDTRTLDGAFNDRFIKLDMGYLSAEQELGLITKRIPNVSQADAKQIVSWANACREQEGKALTTGVSTRQVIIMSQFLANGFTVKQVYDRVFINLFDKTRGEDQKVRDLISAAN